VASRDWIKKDYIIEEVPGRLILGLIPEEKTMEVWAGRKENGGVGGKKGYISSSSCDFIRILRFARY